MVLRSNSYDAIVLVSYKLHRWQEYPAGYTSNASDLLAVHFCPSAVRVHLIDLEGIVATRPELCCVNVYFKSLYANLGKDFHSRG
jgi:hypothetical protein